MKGYILIETAVGKSKDVVSGLQDLKLKEIKSVDLVTGPYDVIAVMEHDDIGAIELLVINTIHPVPGVLRTVTCLSFRI
jgi:DNA-binding Lrp family transcriptional regulator